MSEALCEEQPEELKNRVNICELYRSYCVKEHCRPNSAVLNYIECRGATYHLERLTLSSNYLGPRGLRPVIRLVDYCQTLTYLDLEGNGADNDVVERLCAVLENHLSFETLILRNNPITTAGGKFLLTLAERNPRILMIDLSGTDVFTALICKIDTVISGNRHRASCGVPQLTASPEAYAALSSRGHLPPITWPAPARPALALALLTPNSQKSSRAPSQRHEALPIVRGAGGATIGRQTPPPPAPAVASMESARLPEARRRELRRQYREKAMLYRDIAASPASRAADRARAELMLIEQTTRVAAAGTAPCSAALGAAAAHAMGAASDAVSDASLRQAGTTQEDVQSDNHAEGADALGSTGHDNAEKGEPGAEDAPGGAGRDAITAQSTEGPFSEGTMRSIAFASVSNIELDLNAADNEPLDAPQWMTLDSGEQFQRLFDAGCRAYTHQRLDAAYTAWTEAMSIAVSKKNREWMAVLSSNLQRLGYELLVREGVENLKGDRLEEADASFQRACELARKARNAAWEADTYRALKDVQHAIFHRYHRAAVALFERAQNHEDQKVTDDDYFIVPGTDVMVHHTEAYVNEWSCMLLVKEAVETWAAARRVAERIGGAAGKDLARIVTETMENVARFLVHRCFDVKDPQALSWLRASEYSYHECIMLSTLWTDMVSCDSFADYHKLFAAVAAAQIGNFYLATNQLVHAQTQFRSLENLATEIGDPLLHALGLTLSALVNWQRARYSIAEEHLRSALLEWGTLRDTARAKSQTADVGADAVANMSNMFLESESDTPAPLSKLLIALPEDFLATIEAASFRYLVSSVANMYRYGEALEVLERSLVCKYRDLLYEKLKVNFGSQATLDHIAATSAQSRSPLLYYFATERYDWIAEENRYGVQEKILIWVVPQGKEMRFVEVSVTQDFKVPSVASLVNEVRRGLLLDPLGDCSENGGGEIITTFPQSAWVEPLQALYGIFIDPVVEFLRALDPVFLSKDGVLTVIPTDRLWLVPFNALIARNGNFLIEDFAVQLGFCATQCAFSALCEQRVLQRDLHTDVVLVQRVTDTPSRQIQSRVAFPFDSVRSVQEGEIILNTLSQFKRDVRTGQRHMDSVAVTTSSEVLVDSLDVMREKLPKCRTAYIATSTTCATLNEESSAGAVCVVVSGEELALLRAAEIARMELFAELVVLSNTNMSTARVHGTHDDVQGLTRGFFAGGVPCVIAGLWCTPDMVPSELFRKFYQLLAEANRTQRTAAPAQRPQRVDLGVGDELNTGDAEAAAAAAAANEAAEGHPHKALILAWAIRELLTETFFRYSPRGWAGYSCFGNGACQ